VRTVYLGELEEFELSTPRLSLRAVSANPGEQSPRPGSDVEVSFAAADALLLPAEPGKKTP
jgi:hypothetical protein